MDRNFLLHLLKHIFLHFISNWHFIVAGEKEIERDTGGKRQRKRRTHRKREREKKEVEKSEKEIQY